MEAFVVRAILPKLAYCLQLELRINPHQQDIGEQNNTVVMGTLTLAKTCASVAPSSHDVMVVVLFVCFQAMM